MSDYSVASLIGKRENNEDQHVVIFNKNGMSYPELPLINMACVFDGHGGGAVSEFLKKNLPKYFFKKGLTYPLSADYINKVYDDIQERLIKTENNVAKRTGSTACVAIHYKANANDYLCLINLGDSRCIICRDNLGNQLTKDHKPNWPEETHRIKALGATPKFDGNDWRIKDLSVSRSFGDLDSTPYLSHRPDIYNYCLDGKKDKFIVVACDGLYDVMSVTDIVNYILLNCYDDTTKNRKNKDIDIAKKLADYAINVKGSTDNVSVIVLFFN